MGKPTFRKKRLDNFSAWDISPDTSLKAMRCKEEEVASLEVKKGKPGTSGKDHHNYTDIDIDLIVRLVEDGYQYKQIAIMLNSSATTIRNKYLKYTGEYVSPNSMEDPIK